MNTKTTLLLLAIAGILLGFIALYEKRQPKSWQATEREQYVLVFDRNSVEGIEITSSEEKVVLRKEGTQWMMLSPIKDRADRNIVNEILSRCEVMQKEPIEGCRKTDKNQMKAFGVNQSPVRLKLLGDDMPPELLFGKETAVEGKMYVRLDGSKTVSVASNEVRNLIVRKPDEFRDHQLADFNSNNIGKFSIKTAAGEIHLSREAGRWCVVKPLKARADKTSVNAFLESVLQTQIVAFLPGRSANLNSYGLSEPRGTVTFWVSGRDQPVLLEIGARDEKTGGVFARFSAREAICLLPKESENILNLRPNDLRDRRLIRLNMDTVDRITLQPAGKPPVLLQRQQEDWILGNSKNRTNAPLPANSAKILKFVRDLQIQKISAFVTDVASDLAKYGFDQPQLRVIFSAYASENTVETSAGEQPILTLAFGKTEGNVVYARVEDEPSILAVDKELLGTISQTFVEWRARRLFSFKLQEITNLETTSFADGIAKSTVSLMLKTGNWELDSGAFPGMLNRVNIQSLLNTLATLNVMEWTSEPGPVPAFSSISFTTNSGQVRKLILGAPAPDGTCLGMLVGEAGVFRISAPDLSALQLRLIEPFSP